MKKYIWVFTILLLCGCMTKKDAEAIYQENASGVVMVVCQYYYKVALPNGEEMYFAGFDEDGDIDIESLSSDLNELEGKRTTVTGSGFFISDDGKILTNRHVVKPKVNEEGVKNNFNAIKQFLQALYTLQLETLDSHRDSIIDAMSEYMFIDDDGDVAYPTQYEANIMTMSSEIERTESKMKEVRSMISSIDEIDMSKIEVEPVCEYAIAYNNTHVTKFSDLSECVVVSVSDRDNVDLATLQLKNHRTPENSQILKFYNKEEEENLAIGEIVHMIGYNAGFVVSNTAQGIKSQCYSGSVTQISDNYRLLYSISALPGSSGSPVFDEYGYVVAINYAGLNGTQNFNYGIPAKRIREYLQSSL